MKHAAGRRAGSPLRAPLPQIARTTAPHPPRRHSLHLQGQAEVQGGAAADGDVVGDVSRPERAKLAPQPKDTLPPHP